LPRVTWQRFNSPEEKNFSTQSVASAERFEFCDCARNAASGSLLQFAGQV
jgi:hypothetical protein